MKRICTLMLVLVLVIATLCFPASAATYDDGVWEIYRRNTPLDGGLVEQSSCTSYLYVSSSSVSKVYCHCTDAYSAKNSNNAIATVTYNLKYTGDNGNGTIKTGGSMDQTTTNTHSCSIPAYSTIVGTFSRSGASGVMYNYAGTIKKA